MTDDAQRTDWLAWEAELKCGRRRAPRPARARRRRPLPRAPDHGRVAQRVLRHADAVCGARRASSLNGRIGTAAAEVPGMAFAANVDRALLLRRRALKKAEGRRRLALLCLAVVVVLAPGGYWLLANSSAFAVSGVSVSGGGTLLSAEVRQAAVDAVGGRSLLQVDAGAIERAVERLPYVRSATVDRAFPHTLSIQITTYRPVAVVRSGKSAYLVSGDGRVLDTGRSREEPSAGGPRRARARPHPRRTRAGGRNRGRARRAAARCRTPSSTGSATSTSS